MDEKEDQVKPNPVSDANFVSRLFFWYLNPLFKTGYRRSLEVSDMYNVVEDDSSKYLTQELEREWDKELHKLKDGRKPSLLKAMVRAFGCSYMLMGLVAFFEEGTKVAQPLLLGGLIRYFASDSDVTRTEAYLYAGGVSLCAVLLAILHHPYFYQVQRIGMWLRVACCSLIYKKSLRLSNRALGGTTTGQIVNLLSNDVNRFDQAILFLHFLWVGPLQALTVLAILWYKLGPASLAGFIMLVLLIPLQTSMGKLFSTLRRKTAVQTDERIRLMNEILNGMRVIKMYCWENMFGDLVAKVRELELTRVMYQLASKGVAMTIAVFGSRVLIFSVVLCWTLPGNALRAHIIFPTASLLHVLRGAFFSRGSLAVTMGSEAWATVKRLKVCTINCSRCVELGL